MTGGNSTRQLKWALKPDGSSPTTPTRSLTLSHPPPPQKVLFEKAINTNYKQQTLPRTFASRSAGQKPPCILWNPKSLPLFLSATKMHHSPHFRHKCTIHRLQRTLKHAVWKPELIASWSTPQPTSLTMLASWIQYTPSSSQASYHTDRNMRSMLLSQAIAYPYADVGKHCDPHTTVHYRCANERMSVLYPLSQRLTNFWSMRKVKFTLEQATKAQRRSRSIAVLFL